MDFTIDEQYLENVTVRTEHNSSYEDADDELVRRLKFGKSFSTSSIDHPEFTKLREQLGRDGFVEIQRGWWNGDSVLKKFTLNGKVFKKNDRFVSAGAMKIHLKHK